MHFTKLTCRAETIPFLSLSLDFSEMPVRTHCPLVVSIITPNIGGWIGGYLARKNVKTWYETLKKPTWTPPNTVFAPAWTSIYCSIGYASYLVWKDGNGFKEAAVPLSLYGANLALNWAWTPIFFVMRNPKLALVEIIALLGSTVITGIAFYHVNPTAGYLMVPYLAWTSFATALNYVIHRDNKASTESLAAEGKKE